MRGLAGFACSFAGRYVRSPAKPLAQPEPAQQSRKIFFQSWMDCRVKPGNDDLS
jgi:hypothetical protein